jgi:hypothetical protein
MTFPLVPPASASREEHADWLEIQALREKDGNTSIEDLVRVFRRSGSTDAVDDELDSNNPRAVDRGSELSQTIAEDAFRELEDRQSSSGAKAYPFDLGSQYIQLISDPKPLQSVYTFLLLLSQLGKDAGTEDGAHLFEEVSAYAAREYMGGSNGAAQLFLMGFPRRSTPAAFRAAISELCSQLNEGGGCRDRKSLKEQKDAKLDLVAWKSFPDGRPGKLIGFGQCATGRGWRKKLSELNVDAFCKSWFLDSPPVLPVPMFFVPFRAELSRWDVDSFSAGILFDRCRIAALSGNIPWSLRRRCGKWAGAAAKRLRQ